MKRFVHRQRAFAWGLTLLALGSLGASERGRRAEDLSPELEPLRPFLGTWKGEFQDADERPPVARTWRPILNGQAVRETRTVAAAGFEAETVYYYDRQARAVAYVAITNNGYVGRGRIAIDGDEIVQSGTQFAPDSSASSIRVTYRFEDDETLVNRLYNLENDESRVGHTIVYRRESRTETSMTTP